MTARFSGLSSSKMRSVFPGLVLPKTQKQSKQVKVQSWKHCSRKISPFFIFPGTVLPFCNFSRAHFGSTVPGKTSPRRRESSLSRPSAGPISPFLFFRVQYFHFYNHSKCIITCEIYICNLFFRA